MSTMVAPGFASDLFAASPVADEFGHVCSCDETLARLSPLLRKVPITRVFDVTPLDTIGVPVWSAVTPLASDLTVHAGKGATPLAARVSAIMEAVERTCAESMAEKLVLRSSFRQLQADGVEVVDPYTFDLPYETSYSTEREIAWVEGYDLLKGGPALVPLDLVLSLPMEGITVGVETNGLASGNTFTEAVVHALYEVIERDAVSQEEFIRRHADAVAALRYPLRTVDLHSLPPPGRDIVDLLEKNMMPVQMQHLEHPTGVYVFAAVLVDSCFPGVEEAISFAGYGADLEPGRAITRALLEAIQGHTMVIGGSRDTFEGTRAIPDRAATLLRRLDLFNASQLAPFPATSGVSSGDLATDLYELLSRLSHASFERCIVVSLTNPDLGIPVVRVLVPGMAAPYGASTRRPGLRLLRSIL